MSGRLPSVAYERPGRASLFDCWESGQPTDLLPPLSVRDPAYRAHLVHLLAPYRLDHRTLVSVGAGNGFVEAELSAAGWDVLATDPAESALTRCREKGLRTARFALLEDPAPGTFDVIYCDGVLGHLWEPGGRSTRAWTALAELGRAGSICVAANELADGDAKPQFAVRSSPGARFYRPPAHWFERDAAASGRWEPVTRELYHSERAGSARRRELLVLRYWCCATGGRRDRTGTRCVAPPAAAPTGRQVA